MPSTSPSACQHLKQEKQHLGVDPQRGRHADVWLKSCPDCHRHWIHYYFEYEYLTGRGRWYEGEISAEQAKHVTADTAAALLESLPSYQAGGSYFGGKVHSRSGALLDNP